MLIDALKNGPVQGNVKMERVEKEVAMQGEKEREEQTCRGKRRGKVGGGVEEEKKRIISSFPCLEFQERLGGR